MKTRTISIVAGLSYIVIFFAAIFANFFVLEQMLQAPLETIEQSSQLVRFGVMAFLIAAVFDVIVAWALNVLYKKHSLSSLSTYFRLLHAGIMGLAVFALLATLSANSSREILGYIDMFNNLWLIGLFFFGIHLILLAKILSRPKVMVFFLAAAGVMYMIDTAAHFLMANYVDYADIFLTLVAVPSIVGEMSLGIWLLVKGGKQNTTAKT